MSQDLQLRLVINADGTAAVSVVKQTAAEVKALGDAQGKAALSTKQAGESASSYIDALKRELAALQLSSNEFRAREAALKGATAAQLEQVRQIGQSIDAIHRQTSGLITTGNGVPAMLAGWIAPVALLATVRAITGAIYDARLQVEKFNATQLFANNGDLNAAARDIEFVKQRANALGVEFLVVANAWGKFNAAARGSSLAGQGARDVFDSILKASAVLRMSSSETEGALLAVQQMMSKGNVQAEELRGQLGERLPGAFGIAARAMGVTEKELNKLLETGQVMASDFLPKFAAELTRALGDEPQRAAAGTQAATNRLYNAWTELKQELAQTGSATGGVNALTTITNNFTEAVRKARTESTSWYSTLWNIAKLTNTFSVAKMLGSDTTDAGVKNAKALELGSEISSLGARIANPRAGLDNVKRLQEELDQKRAILLKMYEVDTLLWTTEKDTLTRRAENQGAIAGLLEGQKSSNDRYLKELASAGDKKAKLALANKEIDDKFAKDLSSGTRTLAEINVLRAAEYKKIYGGDNKQAAEAVYRETIATQERLQASIQASVKDEVEALKRMRDAGVVSEQEYYERVAQVRIIGQAQLEESISRQLAAAQAAVARGDAAKKAEVAKYLGEQKQFGAQRKKIEEETEDAILALKKKKWVEEIAARNKHNEVILAMIEKTAELQLQNAADLEDKQFELSLLGKDEEVQARLQALRQIELAQRRALTQAYKDYRRALDENFLAGGSPEQQIAITDQYNKQQIAIRAGAAAQREGTLAIIDQRSELQKSQQFWDGFFQSLKGGWKGVRDYVKNFFFDWLLKQLSQQFTMNIAVGASGGAGGGLSGILGALLGGGSGGASAGGGGGGGIIGSLLGSMPFVAGAGPLAAGTGLAGMFASMGMSGIATGIAQFASFIPVIGPFIALAAAILPGLLKNKEGLWFDFGSQYMGKGKGASQEFDTALGGIAIRGEGKLDDVKPFVAQMQNLAKNFVDIFGQSLAEKARTALGNWTGFSNRGKGTEYENGQELAAALATESKDVMAEYFSRVFSVVDQRLADTISAWTGTTEELTKYIQGILGVQQSLTQQAPLLKAIIGETINLSQVVDLQREGEALADTFSRILNTFSLTNSIAEAMGKGADAFGEVGIKSLEARERLIALSGGLQALSGNMTTYLEQFFTEQERAAMQQKLAMQQVEAGFSSLGIAVPTSREAFRALVQGIDLTTVAGQELFAALIKLAPAFAVAIPAKDGAAVTEAVGRSDEYLNNFFTAAERAAMQLAESGKAVDDVFALLGLSVPKTRDEFRALVESQDLTTESGRQTYNALIAVAGKFVDVTSAATLATTALDQLRISVGDIWSAGSNALKSRLDQLFAIIDAGGESTSVKLARKMAAAQQAANEFAQRLAEATNQADREAARIALQGAQDKRAQLAADLALLTTLQAQYGGNADAMFELEKWRQDQITAAHGNAATLLFIEQSYQAKRNAILAGGVASGLDTLKSTLSDWLKGLLLNNQLTTLTPLQRLEEARAQYEAAITSGDASKITGAADAYLREARAYFASGSGYDQIFTMVRAQIDALAKAGTVYVAPATSTAPGAPGSSSSSAATAATAAAAAASAAADATAAAVKDAKTVLANIMATVNHTIGDEAAAQRQADYANTTRIVDAVSTPSRIAV